ncbi:MAG: ATP-binding protein, partial [Ignavibacteriae bacterium]|nr:ATP-binding protein [Ignavibacteriota bacterium]
HEGIMRDITVSLQAQKAMVEAKEKAEEVSRLKTSFLANMSHEIRTPLNGILGFADILKNELKDPTHKKFADVIEKSGNRLLETLDLILSFSKLEAEKEDVHYSNVRIENVIDEVLKSFEVMAKNKNLFLKLSVKEEKLITNIDERFLRQIMNNLINNAIKYTEAGGITVTLLKDNSNVVIKVKDTGIGIVNDKHKIIFEEFRQESEGHGRSFEGTGLGLAITKRFVELMNGTIEVESEAGIGSIFTVKFPYEKAPETITIKMQKEEPNKKIYMPSVPDKDKLFILLVENDSMNLDFTVTILKDYYNVESAVDGTEALERVKNKAYNIILMDINLGKGMDGIEVVKKIRKLPGYEKTPIVALTAFVLPGDREEFLAGGCTHYLGKPFTKNQILELLKKIKV